MMTLRECARMETTMCKCAVSNVCARKHATKDNQKDAHQETAKEDAVCGAGTDTETPDRKEPMPARLERDAHQETSEEDAVCGAEAGRMC